MSKKTGVKPGDIVAIQLAREEYAVGLVLHVSALFKNAVMMGFYDILFASMEDISIEKLGGDFIDTPNYTGKQLITRGPWKVVGHSAKLLEESTVPELRVAYTLYYKDQALRQISTDEMKDYVALIGQGGLAVENKLRKYFTMNSTDPVSPSVP